MSFLLLLISLFINFRFGNLKKKRCYEENVYYEKDVLFNAVCINSCFYFCGV